MSTVEYQTMPPLSMEEYAALEESIREMGVQVPILVDERGVVIDGHHRQKIAQDLGIECPSEVRHLLSEEEKRKLSIRLNIDRRQLSREQRRAIIASSLIAAPEKSNREHARDAGVSHVTVATVRDALESTGQIDQLDKTTGADGKERPATFKRIESTTEKFTEEVDSMNVDLQTGEVLDGKQYKRPEPAAPRRRSLLDDARKANTELYLALSKIQDIKNDDRFEKNKADIQAALQPGADLADELLAEFITN